MVEQSQEVMPLKQFEDEIRQRERLLNEARQVGLGLVEDKATLEERLQNLTEENEQLQTNVECLQRELGELRQELGQGRRKASAWADDKDDIIEQLEQQNQELQLFQQRSIAAMTRRNTMGSSISERLEDTSFCRRAHSQHSQRSRASTASTGSACQPAVMMTRQRSKSLGDLKAAGAALARQDEIEMLRRSHDQHQDALSSLADEQAEIQDRLTTELALAKAEAAQYRLRSEELKVILEEQAEMVQLESLEIERQGSGRAYGSGLMLPGLVRSPDEDPLLQEVTALREKLGQAMCRLAIYEGSADMHLNAMPMVKLPSYSLEMQLQESIQPGKTPEAPSPRKAPEVEEALQSDWQKKWEASEQQVQMLQARLAEITRLEADLREQVRLLEVGRGEMETQLQSKDKEVSQLQARLDISEDRLRALELVEAELRKQLRNLEASKNGLEGELRTKTEEAAALRMELVTASATHNERELPMMCDTSMKSANSASRLPAQRLASTASLQSCLSQRKTPENKKGNVQVNLENVEMRAFPSVVSERSDEGKYDVSRRSSLATERTLEELEDMLLNHTDKIIKTRGTSVSICSQASAYSDEADDVAVGNHQANSQSMATSSSCGRELSPNVDCEPGGLQRAGKVVVAGNRLAHASKEADGNIDMLETASQVSSCTRKRSTPRRRDRTESQTSRVTRRERTQSNHASRRRNRSEGAPIEREASREVHMVQAIPV